MKHHLPILLAVLLSLGGSLLVVDHSHASPASTSLEKIFTDFEAALKVAREVDHANRTDAAEFARESEVSLIEFAFLAITPAPARIEEARSRVPDVAIVCGYRRHAWLIAYQIRTSAVSNDPIGLSWRGPRCYDRLA